MIGGALVDALLKAGIPSLGTSRRAGAANWLPLDLERPQEWRLPDSIAVAYLCAGPASIQACAEDPESNRLAHVTHTLLLARELSARDAFIVFLSSNMVFDGSLPAPAASAPPHPLTEYGKQKLEVEEGLSALSKPHAIVRFAKVLGPRPPLLTEWMEKLGKGAPIEPFEDKVMAPVPLPLAAETLLRVGRRRLAGVTQLSASSDISYAEIGRFLASRLSADAGLVRPKAAQDCALAPANTTLDTARLAELGLAAPDPWQAVEWSLR